MLPSRCKKEHSSIRRNDPFWGWDIGNRPGDQWTDFRTVGRYVDSGVMKAPAECLLSREEAWRKFTAADRVPVLGAVEMLGVASPAQVACTLGTSEKWAATSLRLAYGAGLLKGDLSRMHTVKDNYADLYKPLHLIGNGHHDHQAAKFYESLPHQDYVGVFGGRERRMREASDRHDHLTAELLLRVAEHTNAALVLGEAYTRHRDLFDLGRALRTPDKVGDGLIVRDDGLHVVVETTANQSSTYIDSNGNRRHRFADKIKGWAEAMLAGGTSCSDVVVVFLEATKSDSSNGAANWTRLRTVMRQELRQRRYIEAGISQRFFVQRWMNWFPDKHVASEAFPKLSALSPTGKQGEDPWVRHDLLDPADVSFQVPWGVEPTAVLDNAALLFGVPYWMRTEPSRAPDLTELAMRRMGFDSIPVMPRIVPARRRADGGTWPNPIPLGSSRDLRPRPLRAFKG